MVGILEDLNTDCCQDLPWFMVGILEDLNIDSCQDLVWFTVGILQDLYTDSCQDLKLRSCVIHASIMLGQNFLDKLKFKFDIQIYNYTS